MALPLQEKNISDEKFPALYEIQELMSWIHNRQDNMHMELQQSTFMEFPQFDGQDILSWLFWCDRFFEIHQTPEEQKVKLASTYLDNKTFYQWHCSLKRRLHGCLPIWEEYIGMLKDYVGTPLKTPMEDLIYLRQTGDLASFNADFDLITAKLNLPEDYLVAAYVSALKQELKRHVYFFNPSNMYQARLFARTKEIILQIQAEKARKALKEDNLKKIESQEEFPEIRESEHKKSITMMVEEIKDSSPSALMAAKPSSGEEYLLGPSKNSSFGTKKVKTTKVEVVHNFLVPSLPLKNPLSSKKVFLGSGSCDFNYVGALEANSLVIDKREKSFDNILGMDLGHVFEGNGPNLLLPWVNSTKSVYMFVNSDFHVNFSPTRSLLQIWFKGELIPMLVGRFFSLSGKEK